MNQEYIEAQVVSLTRKIHPQDLGEETSKLENILRQALEEVVEEGRERVRGEMKKALRKMPQAERLGKVDEKLYWANDIKKVVLEVLK